MALWVVCLPFPVMVGWWPRANPSIRSHCDGWFHNHPPRMVITIILYYSVIYNDHRIRITTIESPNLITSSNHLIPIKIIKCWLIRYRFAKFIPSPASPRRMGRQARQQLEASLGRFVGGFLHPGDGQLDGSWRGPAASYVGKRWVNHG